jgi:hypothetical protein
VTEDEYLYVISGSALCFLTYMIVKHYRIDPIDCGLLVNEQAINLTS